MASDVPVAVRWEPINSYTLLYFYLFTICFVKYGATVLEKEGLEFAGTENLLSQMYARHAVMGVPNVVLNFDFTISCVFCRLRLLVGVLMAYFIE